RAPPPAATSGGGGTGSIASASVTRPTRFRILTARPIKRNSPKPSGMWTPLKSGRAGPDGASAPPARAATGRRRVTDGIRTFHAPVRRRTADVPYPRPNLRDRHPEDRILRRPPAPRLSRQEPGARPRAVVQGPRTD